MVIAKSCPGCNSKSKASENTSCSGFISFYSNDVEEWLEIQEPDDVEAWTFLSVYAAAEWDVDCAALEENDRVMESADAMWTD